MAPTLDLPGVGVLICEAVGELPVDPAALVTDEVVETISPEVSLGIVMDGLMTMAWVRSAIDPQPHQLKELLVAVWRRQNGRAEAVLFADNLSASG